MLRTLPTPGDMQICSLYGTQIMQIPDRKRRKNERRLA